MRCYPKNSMRTPHHTTPLTDPHSQSPGDDATLPTPPTLYSQCAQRAQGHPQKAQRHGPMRNCEWQHTPSYRDTCWRHPHRGKTPRRVLNWNGRVAMLLLSLLVKYVCCGGGRSHDKVIPPTACLYCGEGRDEGSACRLI
ncbi:hypothetical protein E2C01_006791 [Portunus trituberculatus]|uniref:Uncharacterized protein n=1 Tax=Portunus trituberculatus TaxID=210409 RepID=A0A5B7CXQ5_PORTR|nr:hypothetical protein [Portunus trituberculatus]